MKTKFKRVKKVKKHVFGVFSSREMVLLIVAYVCAIGLILS